MPPPNHQMSPAVKKRDVHVHGRAVRIARMQHQRHAHRFERAPGELRARGARRRRQVAALNAREIHATALEQLSVLDDAAGAAAAFRALPRIAGEALAIDDFSAETMRSCRPEK
jgi:hypothetical protein